MIPNRCKLPLLLAASSLLVAGCGEARSRGNGKAGTTAAPAPREPATAGPPRKIRFATFNASLNRNKEGQLLEHLSTPDNEQARQVAEVIQRVRPDVLLLNEFDYDEAGRGPELFAKNFLAVGQRGQEPIEYPYRFTAAVNTGVPSGHDLDLDGKTDGPADGFGFGRFPGQYGMLVLSRLPIDAESVRTFRKFLWRDMPDAELPRDPESGEPYYPAETLAIFRLSSKSHWDVPIDVGGQTIHLLAAHPTPPVFDGPEDRNGCRNRDEIRLWADYLDPARSEYLYDDNGRRGGLAADAPFIVAGDMNADPADGDSRGGAIDQLLAHPRVADDEATRPASHGGVEQAEKQGKVNLRHRGDPAHDTADFSEFAGGNLRIDYLLPSRGLPIVDAGVFWPPSDKEGFDLSEASDHHLVWIDVEVGGKEER